MTSERNLLNPLNLAGLRRQRSNGARPVVRVGVYFVVNDLTTREIGKPDLRPNAK